MILPALIGVFRLKKQVRALHDSAAVSCGEPLTNTRLQIMTPLISCIDPPKPRA